MALGGDSSESVHPRSRVNLCRFRALTLTLLALGSACSLFRPELRLVSAHAWEEVLDSHQGAIVVVFVWADWCRPCVEALPGLAELQSGYESEGVRFISLSLDDGQDKAAVQQAQRRLREAGTGGEHYLLGLDFTEAIEALNLSRIPAIVIYNQAGQRWATVSGDAVDDRIFPEDLKGTLDAMLGGE